MLIQATRLFPSACLLASMSAMAFAEAPTMSVHRDIVFATVGDRPLKLDLYMPGDKQDREEAGAGPHLIVWIHGGGWRKGSKARLPIRKLVDDGYAMASISYRFTDTAIFPAQIHDCKGAIRWLRANADKYGYDGRWIAVGGSSAGGHLALLLGTSAGVAALEGDVGGHLDRSSAVQAVLDYFGPSDFVLRGKTQPERAYTEKSGSFALLGGLKDGKISPELEKLASPAFHVDRGDPPLIVFQGANDKTVLPDQSQRIISAYKAAKLDATLVLVKGAGHGGSVFYEGDNLERARQFLEQHRPRR